MEEAEQKEGGIDTAISELKNNVQAILFSAARAVDIEELAKLTKTESHSMIREAIKELKVDMQSSSSPLLLTTEGDNSWKLTVRDKYVPMVKEVTPHTEMEAPMLATLALIAWKQPVLQSEIIKRRSGVAYEHIAKLQELGFISKEKKGRSFILKPTGKFLDYFDLPDKKAVQDLFNKIEPPKVEAPPAEEVVVYQAKGMGAPGAEPVDPDQAARDQVGALQVYNAPEGADGAEEVQDQEKPQEATAAEENNTEEQPAEEEQEQAEPEPEERQSEETPGQDVEETEEEPQPTPEPATPQDEAAEKTKEIVDELMAEKEAEEKKKEEEEKEAHPEKGEEEEAQKEHPKRVLDPELEEFAGEEKKLGEDQEEDL